MNDYYPGQRVLVTGGTGFIGRYLVAELLKQGARVQVLVRRDSRIPSTWSEQCVEICYGKLEDESSLLQACRDKELILHAAGFAHAENSSKTAERHWQVNALGTRRLLQAAVQAGVERFVFLSSVKAMGEGGQRCIDEDWPKPPLTAYGKAKRAAEDWVLQAGKQHGMHAVNLRPAMVYGLGGKGNLERMINAVEGRFFPPLPEVGNQRSMVHVTDVVQAALCVAQDPIASQKTYIVTDGKVYSGRVVYDLIRSALNRKPLSWAIPAIVLHALARLGDWGGRISGRRVGFDSQVLDRLLGWACYRSDRIQQEVGYRPEQTLETALPEIVQAHINNKFS